MPSAFTVPTGRAHWEVLLRARAIETGAYVLAPAQSGSHAATPGRRARTYGHSLAVGPWGEVLVDAGEGVGRQLRRDRPGRGRHAPGRMVPSLGHDRAYDAAVRAMTEPPRDPVVIALFSEIVMVETLARTRLTRVLPRGMELSHFMVLNHFARLGGEKTPAQLARVFHVTKGAMSNTVARLDAAGYIHVRPDWEDGRRKWVSISPARARRPRPCRRGDRAGLRRRGRRGSASSGCGRRCRSCGGCASCSIRTEQGRAGRWGR